MDNKAGSVLNERMPSAAAVDSAAQTAHATIDRLAAKAGPAIESLRTSAAGAAESLQAQAQRLGEMEKEWAEKSRAYVRDNPLTAVGIGVVVGMLLSRLSR